MQSVIELLPWDTAFFGMRVARLRAEVSAADLAGCLSSAETSGIQLVYWMPPHDRISDATRIAYERAYVQHQLVYCKKLVALAVPEGRAEIIYSVRPQSEPDDEIVALAIQAGWKSRFRLDARFPQERFEAMYRVWIDRGCRGEDGALVLCASDRAESVVGFVLLRPRDHRCEVDLIAVKADYRQRGIGKGLLRAAEERALNAKCREISIATQADNHEAKKLYAAAGYVVSESRDCFHFWLKEC